MLVCYGLNNEWRGVLGYQVRLNCVNTAKWSLGNNSPPLPCEQGSGSFSSCDKMGEFPM